MANNTIHPSIHSFIHSFMVCSIVLIVLFLDRGNTFICPCYYVFIQHDADWYGDIVANRTTRTSPSTFPPCHPSLPWRLFSRAVSVTHQGTLTPKNGFRRCYGHRIGCLYWSSVDLFIGHLYWSSFTFCIVIFIGSLYWSFIWVIVLVIILISVLVIVYYLVFVLIIFVYLLVIVWCFCIDTSS